MKRRPPASAVVGLPPEIAAGPRSAKDYSAWTAAGRAWSQTNLGNFNGWWRLVSQDVRRGPGSVHDRLKVIDAKQEMN